MDKTKKQSAVGLQETQSLASALPEQRPKYVQILQQEKNGSTPQSPVSVGAGTSNTNTAAPSSQPTESAKTANKKPNGNKNNKGKNAVLPNGKRPYKVYLKKQEVVALPADIDTREMAISPENVVYFSGPNHFLSALYAAPVVVDGNEYNSVEHYYQACKLYVLAGQETAAKLKASETPLEVKKSTKVILKEAKIPAKLISEWKDKESIGVLKHVILHKFNQNEELKAKLLETGDKILIQTYLGDSYFAAGANTKYVSTWVSRHVNQSLKYPKEVTADNVKYLPLVANGKNALGWILMQVRDEIRESSA
ncbi:hypothetical protein GCK72_009316 [Caenorhabditis remanei]|uniref:NADAR domain-containing protein n=1 Tax=Caenorhabditis remanei TaxID=31234 RepID=A0A6A5H3L5_CAERE|nr:hypothetical protein GCK72_009316 [Caenorhabditis remanei]KAF1761062.1 hypothetical protein GCK72_009316 [Caenorhabditis remanei]